MKAFLDTVQIPGQFLNEGSQPIIGKSVNPDNLPGTTYRGLLGKVLTLDHVSALRLSKLSVGTLYDGWYQLVQTISVSTQAPQRGGLCYWNTFALNGMRNYVVTPDVTAPLMGQVAGVYIDTAPVKGEYCWIQVKGLATVLCAAAVGGTTIGDLALADTASNQVLALADATAFATASPAKRHIGTFYEAPANGALRACWLNGPGIVHNF